MIFFFKFRWWKLWDRFYLMLKTFMSTWSYRKLSRKPVSVVDLQMVYSLYFNAISIHFHQSVWFSFWDHLFFLFPIFRVKTVRVRWTWIRSFCTFFAHRISIYLNEKCKFFNSRQQVCAQYIYWQFVLFSHHFLQKYINQIDT